MTCENILPVEQGETIRVNSNSKPSQTTLSFGFFSTFSKHQASMTLQNLQFFQTWYEKSRVWQSYGFHTRDLEIEWRPDGPIMRSLQVPREAKPRRRAKGKWKTAVFEPEIGSRRTFELNKDLAVWTYQIHLRVFQDHPQPTKVMRTTSSMEPSLIEPSSATMCPEQVRQSHHNHVLIDQTNLGKIVGEIVGVSTHKSSWG